MHREFCRSNSTWYRFINCPAETRVQHQYTLKQGIKSTEESAMDVGKGNEEKDEMRRKRDMDLFAV